MTPLEGILMLVMGILVGLCIAFVWNSFDALKKAQKERDAQIEKMMIERIIDEKIAKKLEG